MEIYKFKNYEDYKEAQIEANIRKINHVWVTEDTVEQIYKIKNSADTILCHGTRNAAEQKLFKKYFPDASIQGTEISHTASKFDMTIEHDFHEELPSHTGKCDIIYSNSFDHSYDPEKSLNTWINQLNDGGLLFLEIMLKYSCKRSDPLHIEPEELKKLAAKLNSQVIRELKVQGNPNGGAYKEQRHTVLMVIKK